MGNKTKIFAILTASTIAFVGCGKPEEKKQMPPAQVTVMTAKPESIGAVFEATGSLEAFKSVQVRARIEGFLNKRLYMEGGFVEEGQTMFVMDQKPFEVALMSAKAGLMQADANAIKTKAELERMKTLELVKAVSKQDLDNAVAAEAGARAQVEAAKASVANAELNLGYTKIKAPVSGFADKALVHEGSFVQPTSNGLLTTVSQIDPIYVTFSISESQHLALTKAMNSGKLSGKSEKADIILADGSKCPDGGKVDFSAPVFDTTTGTMSYRASIKNAKGSLKPGQFVRVKLFGAVWNEAILIPQKALLQGQKGRMVVTVDGDKAKPMPIEVGEWVGDKIIVKSGLKGGEKIVVDGVIQASMPGAVLKVVGSADTAKEPNATAK
jgi:membrane fusion protein, multidrug efflux system